MNIKKRIVTGIMVTGMSLGILAGCGAEKPTDTVDGFLTSIQKGTLRRQEHMLRVAQIV